MRLDFSQFHDLMHKPFTAACRARPGGWCRHVTLWWTYMAWPRIREQTTCRLGLHVWCAAWTRHGLIWACEFCDEPRK